MDSLATRSTPNNRPVGENTVGGSVEYRVASDDDKSLFVEESTLDGSVVRRRSGSSDCIIMIISCVCVEKKAKALFAQNRYDPGVFLPSRNKASLSSNLTKS